MKKHFLLFMAAMVMLLTFSGVTSAAAAKPPITVWVGDQKVAFDVAPVSVDGTTYVEFKALFKALGFTINYDTKTKTISGSNNSVSITLNTLTGKATINGKPSAQPVKLISVQGRTLIPLRFIVDATGSNVDWNAATQTIKITAKGPSAADIKELQSFLAKMDAYDNAADFDGVLSLIDRSSPFYQAVKTQGNPYDGPVVIRTTSTLKEVLSLTATKAVISVSQHSAKVSGAFYLDNDSILQYTLVRGQDKRWMINAVEFQQIDYVNTDKIVSQEAKVPADEKAKILAAIDQQTKAYNNKDINAYAATIDPTTPGLDEMLKSVSQTFKMYDLKYTTELARIVDYTDTEAVIYIVQTIKKVKGPEFSDVRIYVVSTYLKTADGTWVTDGQSKLIDAEYL